MVWVLLFGGKNKRLVAGVATGPRGVGGVPVQATFSRDTSTETAGFLLVFHPSLLSVGGFPALVLLATFGGSGRSRFAFGRRNLGKVK
jgi:hypothetical protein